MLTGSKGYSHAPVAGAAQRQPWDKPQRVLIMAVVRQNETGIEVRLPHVDGCPYFAQRSSMPPDWGWRAAGQLFQSRLRRMTVACNKKWPALFLECVLQASLREVQPPEPLEGDTDRHQTQRQMRAKYAELLDLPLGCHEFQSLRCVVAHLRHSKQMRTGWRLLLPDSSLTDHIAADEDANILIETLFTRLA